MNEAEVFMVNKIIEPSIKMLSDKIDELEQNQDRIELTIANLGSTLKIFTDELRKIQKEKKED